METAIIIWLWVSCYVASVIILADTKGWADLSEVPIRVHLAMLILSPVVIIPTSAASLFRRLFS